MNKEHEQIARATLRWQKRQTSRLLAIVIGIVSLFVYATHGQEVKYDKFKDVTIVNSDDVLLKPQGDSGILYGNPTVHFNCGFETQTAPVNPDVVSFGGTFIFHTSDWRFLDNRHELILLVDGKRLSLGSGRRYGEVDSSGRQVRVYEMLSYSVKYDDLKTIAAAKTVELQISTFESVLPADAPQQMRNVMDKCVSKK